MPTMKRVQDQTPDILFVDIARTQRTLNEASYLQIICQIVDSLRV